MSFDIRSSRALSNDPFGRTLTDLSKRLSAFLSKDQAAQVENPEDIYSDAQDVESVLKYHSFVLAKKFPLNFFYSSASEPDYDKVKLFLASPFPNLGNQLTDDSGFGNHATIGGEPVLVDGIFDLGIVDGPNNVRSVAMRFNRPESEFVNGEYLQIPDNTSLQMIGVVTGFSIFMRFRLGSLANQGGKSITLFEKIDDSTPNDARMAQVSSDGKIIFIEKLGGVTTANETAAGTVTTDTVYDVWFTFRVSGSAMHVYVNNVDETLSSFAGAVNWHSTLSNHDMNIFRRGLGESGGYLYGDLYPVPTIFKEKIVSATEVSHHFTNKWTIADLSFGQVPISNYSVSHTVAIQSFTPDSFTFISYTEEGVAIPSFTTTSFTSTSFTT